MDKKEYIDKIITFPTHYAVMKSMFKDGKWDIQKLEYMTQSDLMYLLFDLQIFEKNKKRLEDAGY